MIFKLGDIEIQAVPKNVKNIYFRVYPENGGVFVSYPRRMGRSALEKEIESKREWIEKTVSKVKSEIESSDGTVSLLGKKHKAVYIAGERENRVEADGDAFVFRLKTGSDDEKTEALRALYAKTLANILPLLTSECENKSGLHANSWQIRDMKTRFGSCTPKTKTVRLSLCLAKYDPDCIRSVIYHELTHLVRPDHGKEFYRLLLSYCPSYRECRKRMTGSR